MLYKRKSHVVSVTFSFIEVLIVLFNQKMFFSDFQTIYIEFYNM